MRIVEITTWRLAIPMRFTFRHALAERACGDSLLVRVADEAGHVGFGESAPRSYVTGESVESVQRALSERLGPRLLGRTYWELGELVAALEALSGLVPRSELAAFCGLELALLDLGGRAFGASAAAPLGPPRRERAVYSGIVSADDSEGAARTCALLREFGVAQVKVKVGRSLEEDLALLSTVREQLGDGPSLRIDANCAWDGRTALQRLEAFAPFRLDAVEQPCAAEALSESALVRRESDVPVVLDESLASLQDAERIVAAEAADVFNLRLSKCGGLLLSERLRELARGAGLQCMLGAQVGESAVLSAAGRLFALRGEPLLFVEGSYGTLLLEDDLSDEPRLLPGAVGDGDGLHGAGLGIEVDLARVAGHLSAMQVLR